MKTLLLLVSVLLLFGCSHNPAESVASQKSNLPEAVLTPPPASQEENLLSQLQDGQNALLQDLMTYYNETLKDLLLSLGMAKRLPQPTAPVAPGQ